MAQTELQPAVSGGTRRKLHPMPRVDMTPMVDLGFLLITFFIFTTTLSEKQVTSLVMPREGGEPMELAASKALTVVLGDKDQVYAYTGRWEDAVAQHAVVHTGYSTYEGIGKLIREKQKQLEAKAGRKGREDLVLLIKPTARASYRNIMATLDETAINAVGKYAIVDASSEERAYLQALSAERP